VDGQELPLEDGRVDHALTTRTLCTIPDVERALTHVRRVVSDSGLALARLDNYYLKGPKTLGYMLEGVATKP
jgi:ubiquinone/menaquinone biosynthesis C-methylase UbiE